MSRFRGNIERRLFNAVLLVLGACDRPIEQRTVNTPPPPPSDASITVAPSGDAPVAVVPVDAAAPDARAMCADYRQRSQIDRKKARQAKPPPEGHQVGDGFSWDAKQGVAICTIVHERTDATVKVMHQPHWCPQGGGTAPPPYAREVPGQKILVERAWIRPDGTIAKSDVEWTAFGMVDEPRHNCGRRFEGLALDAPACDEPGAQLAAMAELEAASVPAFDRLARELAAWGAPAELVRRARRAMRDEVRHARMMTALARRYGHAPRAIGVPALPCRSLEAIAHENAIEGCVREAYGALIATYQAERARPELRGAFQAIAVDERRHAELAEAVHAWIVERLDDTARDAVAHARTCAEAELRASVTTSRACDVLGLPGARDATALCDAYFTS